MSGKLRVRRSESVLAQLGADIAAGRFQTGQPVPTEAELVETYRVGRSTVREAISSLVGHGMLQATPRRGTVVTDRAQWNTLNRNVLRWLMDSKIHTMGILEAIDEARRIFEPASAALVAKRASRHQIIEIETAYAKMEEAAGRGDADAAIVADREFHFAILRATGNPILEAFDTALDSVLGLLFSVTANHMDNFRANLGNHLAVVEAIRAKMPEAAERAMLETINFTTEKMKGAKLIE
ncbi:FadR/GntR family transcriptional regulator [Pseudorhizobium pelagicum]|uniref:FadR/GntR family transcriptional regulator n=1 Tax=Pseudorhizobium pelagicum TaxID=1509405 RepID=UPI000851640A|nr:FadR/GntR family transcriptional regulator [Pseudorhizobium pelagicum]